MEITVAKNSDIKYWKYRDFDLNSSGDGDALAQLQYMKKDIPQLRHALDLPNKTPSNFCIDLKIDSRYHKLFSVDAHPCHYVDMFFLFSRSVPQLIKQEYTLIEYTHQSQS